MQRFAWKKEVIKEIASYREMETIFTNAEHSRSDLSGSGCVTDGFTWWL